MVSNDDYGINGVVNLETALLEAGVFEISNILIFDTFKESVDVDDQLDTLKSSLDRVIVYFGREFHARSILREAHRRGLMGRDFVWIISDAVTGNVHSIAYNNSFMTYYQGLIGIQPQITKSTKTPNPHRENHTNPTPNH